VGRGFAIDVECGQRAGSKLASHGRSRKRDEGDRLGSEIEKIGEVTFAQAAGQVYNRERHGKLRKAVQDVKSKSNHTGISKYMGSRTRGKAQDLRDKSNAGHGPTNANEERNAKSNGGRRAEA
jgi:hypothetical protein